jgi:hypothetical protein
LSNMRITTLACFWLQLAWYYIFFYAFSFSLCVFACVVCFL